VLVVRRGSLLGADRQRARHRGIAFEPDKLSVRYGDLVVAEAGVTRAVDEARWPPTWRGRTSRSRRTSGSATARLRILTNDLTHAYFDENMGTS
jgi:CYTH domain-containing protein